jgi:Zn-dependent protease
MQPERGLEPGRPPAFPPPFPIRADRSWIAAGALLAAHLAFSAFGERPILPSLGLGGLTVTVFFAAVTFHAYAHTLVERLTGSPRTRSRLYIFGDVPDAPRRAMVAFVGPVASAVIGALLLLGADSLGTGPDDVLRIAGWASIALGAVNLIPGLPLDGGHILAAITRRRRLAVRTGQLFGLLTVVGGTWLLFSGPAALDDTAFGLWLLLAGIFILAEARASDRQVPVLPLDDQTAGAWARPFAGRIAATDPVPAEGGPFAVSDGTRLAGVLARGGAASPGTTCADVMVPWSSGIGVRTHAPLREALARLAEPQTKLVVVVDEKGIVRGVLDEYAVRARLVRR